MTQLAEMMENIKSLTVQVPLGEINPAFIDGLTRTLKKSKGKASLHLNVYDPQSNVKVAFLSKGYKVEVSADLLTYFDDLNMPYTIS